jgi:hypothetical protein
MFIGHFAPALVLHRARPSVPLWVLFLATQAVDVLWSVFILVGVEHARIVQGFTESNALDLYDMPYSHSLAATAVWTVVFASLWAAFRPEHPREVPVVGLAVASHFVLDLVVHVPDLPLASTHGPLWGFGLWRHRELALMIECAIFVAAAVFWRRARENRGVRSTVVLVVMTAYLVASYYVPSLPTPELMAVTSLSTFAVCALGAWWAVSSSKALRLR